MFDISTELPFGLSLFTLLIGLGYATLLYRKDDKIGSIWLKRTLFLFRMLMVSFLCFLLLSPLINTLLKQDEKPILILAQDASASVKDYNIYDKDKNILNKIIYTNQFPEYLIKFLKS